MYIKYITQMIVWTKRCVCVLCLFDVIVLLCSWRPAAPTSRGSLTLTCSTLNYSALIYRSHNMCSENDSTEAKGDKEKTSRSSTSERTEQTQTIHHMT